MRTDPSSPRFEPIARRASSRRASSALALCAGLAAAPARAAPRRIARPRRVTPTPPSAPATPAPAHAADGGLRLCAPARAGGGRRVPSRPSRSPRRDRRRPPALRRRRHRRPLRRLPPVLRPRRRQRRRHSRFRHRVRAPRLGPRHAVVFGRRLRGQAGRRLRRPAGSSSARSRSPTATSRLDRDAIVVTPDVSRGPDAPLPLGPGQAPPRLRPRRRRGDPTSPPSSQI